MAAEFERGGDMLLDLSLTKLRTSHAWQRTCSLDFPGNQFALAASVWSSGWHIAEDFPDLGGEKPGAHLFPPLAMSYYLNRRPICFPFSSTQGVLVPQESSHLDRQGRGAERNKEQMRQPSSNILTVSHVLTQVHTLGPDPVWSCEWKCVSSRQENVSQIATVHPQLSIKLVDMMSIRCSNPGHYSPFHPYLCPLGTTVTSLWKSSQQVQGPWDFILQLASGSLTSEILVQQIFIGNLLCASCMLNVGSGSQELAFRTLAVRRMLSILYLHCLACDHQIQVSPEHLKCG